MRGLKTRQRGSPRPEDRRPQRPARPARNVRRVPHCPQRRLCALRPAPRPASGHAPNAAPGPRRTPPPPPTCPRVPRPPPTRHAPRPARPPRAWSRPAGLCDPRSGRALLRCRRRLPPWTCTPRTGWGRPARGLPGASAAGRLPSGTRDRGCRGRAARQGIAGVVGVRRRRLKARGVAGHGSHADGFSLNGSRRNVSPGTVSCAEPPTTAPSGRTDPPA